MKALALTFLLVLTVLIAPAQRTAITDSLQKQLALSKADTNRVNILASLSQFYHRASPAISLKYAQDGLLLAQRLHFRKGVANCLIWKGIILERAGRYPEALDFFLKSLKISEQINSPLLISRNLRHMGVLYANQGDYRKGMDYIFRAKKIQEEIHAVGTLTTTLKVLGEIYFERNQLDSAMIFLNRSYEYEKMGNKYDIGLDDVLKDLGQVQAKLGNYAQAMTYFKQSIAYSITDKDLSTLNEAYVGVARLYQKAGQADSCIHYAQKALEAGQGIHYIRGNVAASQLLSEVYEGINEHESFRYYKIAMAAKDSLFNAEKVKQVQNLGFLEQQRQQNLEAAKLEYQNNVKLYGLLSALSVFLLLALILYRNNRNKQKANELLHGQKQEIDQQRTKAEKALEELKATQTQLVQREKMASLGELTAGIAHEIQNPLNFVNNFSEVSQELVEELKQEVKTGNQQEVLSIADDLSQNLEKISHHGKRADSIVKSMLQHSRASSGERQLTDINALADEYLRLSYHGLRAKDKDFNANLVTDFDHTLSKIEVVPQELGRVLLNLFNNAFYATQQKKVQLNRQYQPEVHVSTKAANGKVEIRVRDNGIGIPENVKSKIFQPFFTTKPTGEGTGLGLSLSYDIITKGHGGELKVDTKEGEYTDFAILLPIKN